MTGSIAISNSHFLQLSEAGTKWNLSFSGYEVFNNMILALDGINRKMLLMSCRDTSVDPVIIALGETLNISIKKTYSGIPAGGLRSKSLEAFIQTITLEFEIANQPSIVILVFDAAVNQAADRLKLEKKAMNWQQLLMKLSGKPSQVRMNKMVLLTNNNSEDNHLKL